MAAMESFTEPPWDANDEPPIVTFCHRYMKRPGRFFLPDLFHIYLAGFGQDFAASCLVYMLPVTFWSSDAHSVEGQLVILNDAFKLWRKMFKVHTHIATFNRNMLGFPDATKCIQQGLGARRPTHRKSSISSFISQSSMIMSMTDCYITLVLQATPLESAWATCMSLIYG